MNFQVKEVVSGCPLYEEFFLIRNSELRVPLGMVLTQSDKEHDLNQIGVYGSKNGKIVCGLLLVEKGQGIYKMRQVATIKHEQGKGLGKQLIQFTEQDLIQKAVKKIILHARTVVSKFYLNLNYKIVGDEFEEVGIPHVFMEKTL